MILACALSPCLGACIASSVVDPNQRAAQLELQTVEWIPASSADVPGTYVSVEVTGALAAVLRMVVYRFEAGGDYSGAALVDDSPPHFEVITGRWRLDSGTLLLDDAPPAALEVAADGSLRMSGEGGRVLLRREAAR